MNRRLHFAARLRLVFLCGLPLVPTHLPAAVPLDLGQKLSYVRLHRLPEDAATLPAAWEAPALIVDLRYPVGDPPPGFAAALAVRPRIAPLFVLTGPAPPAALLAALRQRAPALIIVGLAVPGLTPDIALAVKAEDDRRAFDALESGTSIESLISEKSTKRRFDEAELAREHGRNPDNDAAETPAPPVSSGSAESSGAPPALPTTPAVPPATPAPSAPVSTPAPAPHAAPSATAAAAPPLDLVLQRAVEIHRALLALGKLPRS